MPRVIADGCAHLVCRAEDGECLTERCLVVRVALHDDHAEVCVKGVGAPVWESVEQITGAPLELVRVALGDRTSLPDAVMAAD